MATDRSQVHASGGGRRPKSRPLNDESNGLLKTLWADLRRQELPRAGRPDDDAWFEEHQEERRQYAARIGRAHNVDVGRRENWRRRYWNQ